MRRKGPKLVRLALAFMLLLALLPLTAAPAGALPAPSQAETIKLGTISSTGTITETAYYRYGATATIILKVATDGAGAGDPDVNRENTASVTVTSTTDTTGAAVTLKETGLNTGILTGTVTLYGVTTPATAPPTGQVLVTSGDTVTVTVLANKVVPPATGSGAPTTTLTDTALIDNTGPTFVKNNMTAPGTWTTVSSVDYAYIKSATGTNYYDLAGTASDGGAGLARVDVSTDGGVTYFTAIGTTTWGHRWVLPADGAYTFKAKALDLAGNETLLPAVGVNPMVIKVDNTKPAITDVAVTPAKAHAGLTVKVTAKVADATSGVDPATVKVDLSAIGGSGTQLMYDDATHGDTTSADGIYSISDVNNDTTADVGVGNTLGTFTLTITAKDKSVNTQTATASVEVVNDTTKPTPVSFTAVGVISGSSVRVGDVVTLTVKATDDLSGVNTISVEVKELSAAPTTSSTQNLTKSTTVADTWTANYTVPANTTTGEKTLRATVTDFAGLTDTITAKITVVAALTTYKLDLRTGWNLVSLPSMPASMIISKLFKGVEADIERISTYSASEGRWRDAVYNATAKAWSTALVYMEPGQGYFIKAQKSLSVVVTLMPVEVLATPPAYDLAVGWNLIGYTSLGLKDAALAFGTKYLKGLSVIALYKFDTTTGLPVKLDPGTATVAGDNAELGKGYWVYVDKAGKLIP